MRQLQSYFFRYLIIHFIIGVLASTLMVGCSETPTITISGEKSEFGHRWQLKSDIAPKQDLVIMVEFEGLHWDLDIKTLSDITVLGTRMVIIPKGKKLSDTFWDTANTFSKDIWILHFVKVVHLPMIDVVGKGVILDDKKLQVRLPEKTLEKRVVPEGHVFKVYNVGEPSRYDFEKNMD